MNVLLEKTGVKPVIDKVYAFDQAIVAYEHLAKGAFGKIVIKVSKQGGTQFLSAVIRPE